MGEGHGGLIIPTKNQKIECWLQSSEPELLKVISSYEKSK